MSSSALVRTPKLQLAAEQETVGSHPPKKTSHIQGKRRSPNKMVGGMQSCLESNPISTRDSQRPQKKPLCAPGPRDPTETESDLPVCVCLSPAEARVSSGHRSVVGMAGTGAVGAADLGSTTYGISPLVGGRH